MQIRHKYLKTFEFKQHKMIDEEIQEQKTQCQTKTCIFHKIYLRLFLWNIGNIKYC